MTESTLKQYNSALREWWSFAQEKKYDPYETNSARVLEFLSEKFQKGATYGTINSAKAAIALISSEELSTNVHISRFMRGAFKLRPSKPKYETTWDVGPVLEKIAKDYPLSKLSLHDLTMKTVMLMALGTAHRVQTLSLISLQNISVSKTGVKIKIPDNIKTSRPGAYQPLLDLPFLESKPELCVASTIIEYIRVTKAIRGDEDKFFISVRKPHKAISSQRLSKWIKSFLGSCGIDDVYTAHSTRHASTSRASEKGLNIEIIKKTAGWSQKSGVFAKFYKRPIAENSTKNFATTVLLDD